MKFLGGGGEEKETPLSVCDWEEERLVCVKREVRLVLREWSV